MRKLSLLALVLGLVACRDSGGGGDDTQGVDSSTGQDVKIQDIQNDAMTSGTPVAIKGVVITAIDLYGEKRGDIWIQEPEGGEFSGIHVYGAPTDQLGGLVVGDVVDIAGAEKDEFQYSDFDPGYGITELKPVAGGVMTITKTGQTMVLEPQVVDALMIGGLSDYMARHAEWEKWEGVLIKVNNVAALSSTGYVSSKCPGTECPDLTLEKFDITGDIVVQSALAAMPANKVDRGECLASVVGVLDYFFDYQLLPRTTEEIGLNGTACASENSSALCGDSIDNDGNGFSDCNDNACIGATSTCRTVTTISAIQTAATPPTGGVELQGVYVTALQRVSGTNKPTRMFVQTSAMASASNGILIFGNSSTDFSVYAVGDRVNIIGKVVEFNDSMMNGTGTLTEISLIAHSAGTGTGNIAPVTGQLTTALSVDTTGEPYESVLVNLENVKLTVVGTMANYYAGTMVQGATPFKFDDDLFRLTNAVDTCFDNIEGVWSYQVYDNAWYFLPTGVVLDTAGGTCP